MGTTKCKEVVAATSLKSYAVHVGCNQRSDRPLFKYMQRKYARRMVEEGEICIGTLEGFREEEDLGSEIGDCKEGVRNEYSDDEGPKTGPQLNKLEKRAIPGAGSKITFSDLHIEKRHKSPDVYLLCFSEIYEPEIGLRMCDDYDSCVEVNNVRRFIESLNSKLEGVCFAGVFPCMYMPRRHRFDEPAPHPALIKDPRYRYQREVRMIWEADTATGLERRIVRVPSLCRYCRLVS